MVLSTWSSESRSPKNRERDVWQLYDGALIVCSSVGSVWGAAENESCCRKLRVVCEATEDIVDGLVHPELAVSYWWPRSGTAGVRRCRVVVRVAWGVVVPVFPISRLLPSFIAPRGRLVFCIRGASFQHVRCRG